MKTKMLILAVLAIVAAAVGVTAKMFLFSGGDGEAWDPNASRPTGNQQVYQGTLTVGDEDASQSDGSTEGDNSIHVTLPSEEDDASSTAADVDEDGIPTPNAIKEAQKQDPSLYGRLVIPVAGINVKVFQTASSSVIRAADSAAMFTLQATSVVADLWDQGFSGLQSCKQGTEMYIVTADGKTNYLCARSEAGTLISGDIQYKNGSCVTDASPDAINCYSQSGSGADVWVVEFTKDGTTKSFEGHKDQSATETPSSTPNTGSGVETPTTKPNKEQPKPTTKPSEEQPKPATKEPEDWTSGAGYEYSRN